MKNIKTSVFELRWPTPTVVFVSRCSAFHGQPPVASRDEAPGMGYWSVFISSRPSELA